MTTDNSLPAAGWDVAPLRTPNGTLGLIASAALALAGCGGGTQAASTRDRPPRLSPQPIRRLSVDQQRAQNALAVRLKRSGQASETISCRPLGQHRFECVVGWAQLWTARIAPEGTVQLRLIGSE